MVVEANGGFWGPAAQKIFQELAQARATLTGELKDSVLLQLHQNLGTILRRENARSIVKRFRRFTHNLQDVLSAAS